MSVWRPGLFDFLEAMQEPSAWGFDAGGFGAGIDKLGVQASGPLVWVTTFNLVVAMPLLLPAIRQGEVVPLLAAGSRRCWGLLLMIALLGLLGMACQMEALRGTAVVHVIAIKRLSTLFSSLVGVMRLGEPRGALRLSAAVLMLAGAVLVLSFAAG